VFLECFPIVLVDVPLCYEWAAVSVGARRNGRPIAVADAWIAATATSTGAALVTTNRSDYQGVDGLVLLPEPTDD
jgi:predicted nucleic acid-binding protein